jgi:hypothetical protein
MYSGMCGVHVLMYVPRHLRAVCTIRGVVMIRFTEYIQYCGLYTVVCILWSVYPLQRSVFIHVFFFFFFFS